MTVFDKRGKTAVVAVAAVLLAIVLSAIPAAAQIPQTPQRFYGTVTVAGSPATPGTIVEAYIGTTLKGSTTVDSQGRYGYNPLFYVIGDSPGQVITFKVGGVQANETALFTPGDITGLNLTVGAGGGPPPPPPSEAQRLIGPEDAGPGLNWGVGYAVWNRWAAISTGTVNQIRVKCGATGNVKVAIYSDANGEPGTLLRAVNTSTPVVAGWNSIAITPTLDITGGTYYWLAWFQDRADLVYFTQTQSPVIPRKAVQATYGTFNWSTSPAGLFDAVPYYDAVAAWGTATGQPTVPQAPSFDCSALTFRWSASAGATNYHLQINTNPNFTGSHTFDSEVGNVTSREVTGLTPGTTYYYRVRAGNATGWSSWSTTGSMRCGGP